MSSVRMTLYFPPGVLVFTNVLFLLHFSNPATDPSPSISSSVANHICKQHQEYQETNETQSPLKTRPLNDDSKCGWYLWGKCVDSKSESCPSFALKPCEETGSFKKQGRMITTSQQQKADDCESATFQGLPNPEIVSSMTKYPSVVTIAIGDRCKLKYCTGLILNEHWIIVLQSGCFFQYRPQHADLYEIVAGQRKLNIEEGTEQRRSVTEYIAHPGLNMSAFHYYKDNIGLVRVSAPFEFNENVQPIDLTAIETIAPSISTSNLKIVGYLYEQPMKEEEEILETLIESPLDFVEIDECYDKNMEKDEAPRETLICAGKCIVQGDEKNQPLRNVLYAQTNPESVPVPVGIGPLKHVYGYAQHGVFLNLASYIPWIKENSEVQGQTQPNGESESRIIRGNDAPRYKYKSMVNSEKYKSYTCTKHSCGGSILNEEWFLTAAHCVVSTKNTQSYRIVVGDHDISDNDDEEQVVTVTKIIAHENWNSPKYANDVAVVKVSPPFKFNDKVQKVVLPDPNLELSGPLTSIGWGLNEDIVHPHILQEVEIPMVPMDECQKIYADTWAPPTEAQICAGNETHAICGGDSGGPLYFIDESGQQIVVGIVSYSITSVCKIPPFVDTDPSRGLLEDEYSVPRPAVYANVAYYLDWIKQNAEMVD